MRINKYLAQATGMSRRSADAAISQGRVQVDNQLATAGMLVAETTIVTLDGQAVSQPAHTQTVMLNKPVGYVCSRAGQGGHTVYDLLPMELHHLKSVGRLDKDSSGLLLLTNDGNLANELTHPRYEKSKEYIVTLNKNLTPEHYEQITIQGVKLEDGVSKFKLAILDEYRHDLWRITMREGRNRQIRRTFAALGYSIAILHRTVFGQYHLGDLAQGIYKTL